MSHQRQECKHGTLVRTCRCIDAGRHVVIVPCPDHCPKKDR